MAGQTKKEVRGRLRYGHAWVVPCYGGWAGTQWFVHFNPRVDSVLGRAIFNTREEARGAVKCLGEKGRQFGPPVRVEITMEKAGK